MDDPPALSLSATFPPPPPHHALFTPGSLALLARLRAEGSGTRAPAPTDDEERVVQQLEPPRLDWIEEAGGFEVFGDFYPIPTHVPTVTEMGVTDLMPPPSDPSSIKETDASSSLPPPPSTAEALRRLLLAYLATFSALVRALGQPPPPLPTSQEEADLFRPGIKEVGRLAEVGVNMLVRVNELRGEQAKATLEGLLEAQIARRRQETRSLTTRCAELRATLEAARSSPPPPAPLSSSPPSEAGTITSTLATGGQALERALRGLTDNGNGLGANGEYSWHGERDARRAPKHERSMLDLVDTI